MKRTVLAVFLLAALSCAAWAQNGDWQQFDLFGGNGYPENGALTFSDDGMALKVSGAIRGAAGGYVIENRENLPFSGKTRLKIRVSGVQAADEYDALKLLKLELGNTTLTTATAGMMNRNDSGFINARNGEAEFDISRLRNIRKLNLVFFNCAVTDVKIEVFYR
jgi:hypothetical protein